MSQPDENDPSPGPDEPSPAVLPTRTGGWTPARPASAPAPAPPPPVPMMATAPTWPVVKTEPADDDPDRLRPDELPWGVPARALVGTGGQLPPPIVVERRRSPAAVARLVALAVMVAALVVLAALVLTR